MRLHRETGEGIPSAAVRGKQWEDVREMGGHREVRREGDWALPRRKISKKRGWEWELGKPMGGCSRAAAPENRRNGAREGSRRKIGKRGMRVAARENCGRRGGTEKATGTPPRGDGAGLPVSRRRGSETGQKGRATKGERAAAPFGNRPLLFIYLAGPDGPLPVPTGRSTVKAMRPPPLSARISPPWRCTMSRAMASPSPAPPVAVCREASSR